MAVTKELTPQEKQAFNHRQVKVTLFKDKDIYTDDVCVGLNGKNTNIPRGKSLFVPKSVFEVFENQQRQDNQSSNLIAKLEDDYEAHVKDKKL